MDKYHNGFETNARSALVFLSLAVEQDVANTDRTVEQLRIVDKDTAERIHREYLSGLDSILTRSVQELKRASPRTSETLEKSRLFSDLSRAGHDLLHELLASMPSPPPGLSHSVLPKLQHLAQDHKTHSAFRNLPSSVASTTPNTELNAEPNTPMSSSIYHRFVAAPLPRGPDATQTIGATETNAVGLRSKPTSGLSPMNASWEHKPLPSTWPSRAPASRDSMSASDCSSGVTARPTPTASKPFESNMSLAELCEGSEPINTDTIRTGLRSRYNVAAIENSGSRGPLNVGTIGAGGTRSQVYSDQSDSMSKIDRSIVPANFRVSNPSMGSLSALVPEMAPSSTAKTIVTGPSNTCFASPSATSTILDTDSVKTWANVAATVTSDSSPRDATASILSMPQSPTSGETGKLLRPAAVAIVPGKPDLTANPVEESFFDELRVVWICDLPVRYKLLDVSFKITFGPIMSITLTDNPSTAYTPGRAACVVFKTADSADRFLRSNVCITDSPPVKDHDAIPGTLAAEGRVRVGETLQPSIRSEFPSNTKFILGDPFPRDRDIHAMEFENQNLRRRLKIVRSRLFYDVELTEFKRQVYSVVNHEHVEFIHFYNPGEATIVLASIRVAEYLLNHFKKLARKKGSGYEHIEIAMVHDFNENPTQKLWSQFSKSAKPSCSKGAGDGVEGLYQGPPLRGIDD